MAKVDFSKAGDEHFVAPMSECLEDIMKRGDYLLFDGDLYWSPTTLLRVHTQPWLDSEATVTWWPKKNPITAVAEGVAGAVTYYLEKQSMVFMLFDGSAAPKGNYSNFL